MPNSWPTSAKMKSLNAFGTKTLLSPSPRPEQPADAQRQQALDRVEAVAERSSHGSCQTRMRSSW